MHAVRNVRSAKTGQKQNAINKKGRKARIVSRIATTERAKTSGLDREAALLREKRSGISGR